MSEQQSPEPDREPTVQPSSTPEGPSVVPAPSQPVTEPYEDPADPATPPPTASTNPGEAPEDHREGYDAMTSTPNAEGPLSASGGMGVSSERTGPRGEDFRGEGIEGTGSKGGAVHEPVGGQPTA
jgi:hypothetical protein